MSLARMQRFRIQEMTFLEVEELLRLRPVMVLPLGGTEPLGPDLAMGAVSRLSEHVCAEFCGRHQVLLAPVLHYGCSVPLWAFGGASGVKAHSLLNSLGEVVRGWALQGVKTVLIVNALSGSDEAVSELQKRAAGWKRPVRIVSFSITAENAFRNSVVSELHADDSERLDYAISSMAVAIDSGLARAATAVRRALPVPAAYRTWRKRGQDPRRYRKLFPDAWSSAIADAPDPVLGSRLLSVVAARLDNIMAPELATYSKANKNDAAE